MTRRLLLVEDNDLNRDMLRRRLERRGYEVQIAVDGNEALAMAAARPDAIIMDMSLPEVDGWEATRRLKKGPATREIPIVALTAHAMAGDREKALAAGCDEYETKPVNLERLLAKLEALFEPAAPEPGAAGAPGWIDRRRFHSVAADCGWSDAELGRHYLDGTRDQLGEIEAALEAGDPRELKRLAHGARGASDSCGIPGMSELFQALEERADAARIEGGTELVERCRRRLEAIDRALAGTGE